MVSKPRNERQKDLFRLFVPAFVAGPAAQPRPAPPATLPLPDTPPLN